MVKLFSGVNPKILLILFTLAFIGIVSMLFATSLGIGISTDSIVYIDSARLLASGHGYVTKVYCGIEQPVIKWPPLFPNLLSILQIVGLDPLDGARWLNVLLFGANILLIGLLLYNFTKKSFYIPILGSLLILTSTVMVDIHSMAWTEPLFIFLGFMGLFLLTLYVQNNSLIYLIAGSISISLAYLDRYMGNTLVVAGIIGILFLSQKKRYRRFLDSLVFLTISVSPIALLLIRNHQLTGYPVGNRTRQPFAVEQLDHILMSASSWLFPGSEIFTIFPAQDLVIKALFIAVFLILLIIGIRLLSKKPIQDRKKLIKTHLANTPFLFLIFFIVYLALVITAVVFLDGSVGFDNRILSPAYVSALILVLYLLHTFFHSGIKRSLQITLIIIGAAFAVMYLAAATAWITYSHFNGRQYSNKTWQGLEISKQLQSVSANTLIFSNYHEFVYFQTGRPACPIESVNQILSSGAQLQFEPDNSVLVHFDIQPKYPFKNEREPESSVLAGLEKQFSLQPIVKRPNLSIYRVSSKFN